jgi:hypothetical protein
MFTSLREAWYRTEWKLARQIYQMVYVNNLFAEFVKFAPLMGQESVEWHRRKVDDVVTGTWILPGSAISATAQPKVVRVMTELRRLAKQMNLPSGIVNQVTSVYPDPWAPVIKQAVLDIGRQIWTTAITGQFVDTAVIRAGSSLTAAMLGTLTPNPYNPITQGAGALQFNIADTTLQYRAPGDSEFGDKVVVVNGTAATIRSKNTAGAVTLTPVALPAADANNLVDFTSVNLTPDGLDVLIDSSMSTDGAANGDDISFELLDAMRFSLAEPYQSDSLTAYVMHTKQLTKLLSLARSMGGADINNVPLTLPAEMQIADAPSRRVHYYMGHPILPCDHIPAVARGVTASTRPIYCVSLNPNLQDADSVMSSNSRIPIGGFCGVTAGMVDGEIEDGPYGLGFGIENIGLLEGSDNRAKRLIWNGAWILGSAKAAARHRFVKD